MSFDEFLNGGNETKFINDIIDNAEADAKQNEADGISDTPPIDEPNIFYDLNESNPYSEADILEEEIFKEEQPQEEKSTASIDPDYENADYSSPLSDLEKKRNFLYCQLYVLMMAEGGEMVFKLIGGEFGEDVGNKYSLSKTKQNDIARAWAEVLNFEMQRKTPKGALIMLVVSNFLPLLILAVKSRFNKVQEKKKKKQEQEYRQEVKQAQAEIIEEIAEDIPRGPKKKEAQPTFEKVDDKGTAEVLSTKVEKVEDLPKINIKKQGRGRPLGQKKNPTTGQNEMPTGIVYKNKKPYFVYSWGAKHIVPKKHRDKI